MILSGLEIKKQLNKNIFIDPFDEEQLNPNSYNLKLNNKLLVYEDYKLDMRYPNPTKTIMIPKEGIILYPGLLYLGSTMEHTKTDKFVPMLEGRSSIGRLGLYVHVCAGFGDVGFCHGAGEEILMYDGTYKNIEDIVIGDYVMGIDSMPDIVMATTSGTDMLYNIQQGFGKTYTATGNHLLSVKSMLNIGGGYLCDNTYNIKVIDFINLDNHHKEYLHGYKKYVDYPYTDISLDPYVLGFWLGDGDSNKVRLTVNKRDTEVIEYLKNLYECVLVHDYNESVYRIRFSKKGGSKYRINTHPILSHLKKYNLLDNKHIPSVYLINSLDIRKKLFAGLIDSDGHYIQHSNSLEFSTAKKQLCDDFVILANSLGFNTKIKIKNNHIYHIYITGDFTDIPFICKTKMGRWNGASKRKNRRGFNSRLYIDELGVEKYYGITLGRNKEYFLKDNTVTHNCGFWTLEIHCVQPVRIYPGVEICQIYYHSIEGEYEKYSSGKYQNNTGIQPSLLYRDFDK